MGVKPLAALLVCLALGSCAASSLRRPVRLAFQQEPGTAAVYDTTGCDSLRSIDYPDWNELRVYAREMTAADSLNLAREGSWVPLSPRYVWVVTHGALVVGRGYGGSLRGCYQSATSSIQGWLRLYDVTK